MERSIDEENSLVKYTCPMMIVDQKGNPTNVTIPSEVRSKIFQLKKTPEEALELQTVLNCILPPREWKEDEAVWQQQVSAEPSTRMEVLMLRETLDLWLKQRQARRSGICGVRRDIYVQLFDEMIRQETVVCPERGMLLLRMRDEHRMSLATFKALYESSIRYAIKKSIEAEESTVQLECDVFEAQQENQSVLSEVHELQDALDLTGKRGKEYIQTSQKRHEEQMAFLAITNAQLKDDDYLHGDGDGDETSWGSGNQLNDVQTSRDSIELIVKLTEISKLITDEDQNTIFGRNWILFIFPENEFVRFNFSHE